MILEKGWGIEDENKGEDSARVIASSRSELADFSADLLAFSKIDWTTEIEKNLEDSSLYEMPKERLLEVLMQENFGIDVGADDTWNDRSVAKISWVRKKIEKYYKKSDKILSFKEFSDDRLLTEKNMSADYLSYLASNLNSPKKINEFLGKFLQYKPDKFERQWRSVPKKVTKTINKEGVVQWDVSQNETDNWRTPTELIQNFEQGFLTGDCEEFAFLAQYLLSKLSSPVRSQVIQVGGHATCVWIDKLPNGNFSARTLGEYGYDWNAYVQKTSSFGEVLKTGNKELFNKNGYASVGEAMNAVFDKFRSKDGDGILVAENNDPIVTILNIEKNEKGGNIQIYRKGKLSGEFLNY